MVLALEKVAKMMISITRVQKVEVERLGIEEV